jgi:hypothetical protein
VAGGGGTDEEEGKSGGHSMSTRKRSAAEQGEIDAIRARAARQRQYAPTRRLPTLTCPGCRTRNPIIEYGQYTWNVQYFTPVKDDWSTSDYSYEGDVVLHAKCAKCEYPLTQYLQRRNAQAKRWGIDPPEGWIYADFCADVQIPLHLADRGTKAERTLSDLYLDQIIEDQIKCLSGLISERERRDLHYPQRCSCGQRIRRDKKGSWIDRTGGDGCREGVHQPKGGM